MDKLDLILDKIKDVHSDLKEHKSESNVRFDEYNNQLAEHIEGVQQARHLIKENKNEINDIKKESIIKRGITELLVNGKKIAVFISAVGGAAYITLKLLGKI